MNAVSIFNLNSFTWSDTFDPAETYKSPTKVSAWNAQTPYPESGWGQGVQALFEATNSTTSATPSPTASPTTTPVASSTAKPASSKTLPKVLGGVLGGLLVIALLLGGALFLIRRKKKRDALNSRFELASGTQRPVEMPAGNLPVAELPGASGYLMGPVDAKKGPTGAGIAEVR